MDTQEFIKKQAREKARQDVEIGSHDPTDIPKVIARYSDWKELWIKEYEMAHKCYKTGVRASEILKQEIVSLGKKLGFKDAESGILSSVSLSRLPCLDDVDKEEKRKLQGLFKESYKDGVAEYDILHQQEIYS